MMTSVMPGDAAAEDVPVDGIPIPQQPPRLGVVREGLDDLMRRHAAMGCSVTAR
jgi:hypothetical protein